MGPGKEVFAMRHRPPYSGEFKRRAVQLVTEMGMSPAQVASDVGCSAQAVRNWRRQAEIDRGERDGVSSEERERLEAENAELRRRNERLEQEREILKAAAAFFAQETGGTRERSTGSSRRTRRPFPSR
jgi:transposase